MLDLFNVVVGLHIPHSHDKPACADVSYGRMNRDGRVHAGGSGRVVEMESRPLMDLATPTSTAIPSW